MRLDIYQNEVTLVDIGELETKRCYNKACPVENDSLCIWNFVSVFGSSIRRGNQFLEYNRRCLISRCILTTLAHPFRAKCPYNEMFFGSGWANQSSMDQGKVVGIRFGFGRRYSRRTTHFSRRIPNPRIFFPFEWYMVRTRHVCR